MTNTGLKQASIALGVSVPFGLPVDINGELTSKSGRKQAIFLLIGYSNPNPAAYEVAGYFNKGDVLDGNPTVEAGDCPAGFIFAFPKTILLSNGANLFNAASPDNEVDYAIDADGNIIPLAGYVVSHPIPCVPNARYIMDAPNTDVRAIQFQDAAGAKVGFTIAFLPMPYTIQIPDNAVQFQFTCKSINDTGGIPPSMKISLPQSDNINVNSSDDWEVDSYPAAIVSLDILDGEAGATKIRATRTATEGQGYVVFVNLFTGQEAKVAVANFAAFPWVLADGTWNMNGVWFNNEIYNS